MGRCSAGGDSGTTGAVPSISVSATSAEAHRFSTSVAMSAANNCSANSKRGSRALPSISSASR
eukprot:1217226-Prymnesium_polylepis.1